MQDARSKPFSVPQIAGGIGAALLIIGSFLTWVTVSINVDKFAELLGIDPGLISGSGIETTTTVAGTSGDGKFTLFFGVIALVGVILIAAVLTARRAGAVMLLLAGVAGALLCIWEVTTKDAQINDALSQSGDTLSQLGVSADAFKEVFSVAWGIGLWTALVGGVLAAIGGIMALMSSSSATPATTGAMSPSMGTGFAAPAPPAPAAPMPPAAMPPAEPMSPPTAADPMPGTPPGDEGGTTT